MAETALADLTVLDLSQHVAGPYCTKLLADYGAKVVKVEPPGGEPGRGRGPFLHARPHHEASGAFLQLNTNKLGVTLDLTTRTGKQMLQQLSQHVDLLVESFVPGTLEAMGIDLARLRGGNPRLVSLSITPFGQFGPQARVPATELTTFASTGVMIEQGELEREPLKFGGNQAQYFGGGAGAAAALTAIRAARRTGAGEAVDVSMQEACMPMAELEIERQAYSGDQPLTVVPRRPYHRQASGYPSGVYFCRDGYVLAFGGANIRNLPRIARMLDMPELLTDPRFNLPLALSTHIDDFEAILAPWLLDHDRREIRDLAQENRLPWSMPLTVDELFTDPQFQQRGFFVQAVHPRVGTQTYTGAPFRLPESPWRIARPAPLLGEHNAEIYGEWLGLDAEDLARLRERGIV